MGFGKMKNDDTAALLEALERRIEALESRLPPPPTLTDKELLERAWRAPSLTTEEADFLSYLRVRMSPGGIGWEDKLRLELIAKRAPATAPQQPIDELI